jgi:undecaprenyl-diphosphatase
MFSQFSILNEFLLTVIVGIVQGITEFLPISSTAHMLLASKLFTGRDIGLSVSNLIQFGTFVAILIYFWKDINFLFSHCIKRLKKPSEFITNVKSWIKDHTKEASVGGVLSDYSKDILVAQLAIGTVPILITGLLLSPLVKVLRGNILNVALFLTVGGIIIVLAEIKYSKTKHDSLSDFSWKDALVIGLFQSIAIFPGISRSGATLAGGLILAKNRALAVRFSFLLSLPALAISSFVDLLSVAKDFKNQQSSFLPSSESWSLQTINLSFLAIIVGMVVAFLFGFASLKWLINYLSKNDSRIFIIYRIFLVIFILYAYYFLKIS